MSDPIVIRQLTPSDTAAYRELRLASLRDFQFAHGPDYEEALGKSLAWHAERLARPDYHWFGAFDADALVGAVCLRAKEGRRLRHVASLNSLMVGREQQRAGIGRLLTAHLIAFARSLGHIRQLTLVVNEDNAPARRLYDSLGFQQFGCQPDAIFHEGRYCATQHLLLSLVSPDPS